MSELIVGALQIPFDVLNETGQIVADGLVGGLAVEIPAGTFEIRAQELSPRSTKGVVITSNALKTVTLE